MGGRRYAHACPVFVVLFIGCLKARNFFSSFFLFLFLIEVYSYVTCWLLQSLQGSAMTFRGFSCPLVTAGPKASFLLVVCPSVTAGLAFHLLVVLDGPSMKVASHLLVILDCPSVKVASHLLVILDSPSVKV